MCALKREVVVAFKDHRNFDMTFSLQFVIMTFWYYIYWLSKKIFENFLSLAGINYCSSSAENQRLRE